MAQRRLNGNDLKVDVAALDLDRFSRPSRQKKKLLIFNFNIPVEVVQNDFQNALERVRDFLSRQFAGRQDQVSFQITASYYLIHSETGEIRTWTGSFKSDLNTGIVADFEKFNENNFVRFVINSCQNIEERLTWTNRDTKWTFDGLRSIIINSQIDVQENDEIFRDLNLQRNVRKTFAL